TPKFITEKKRMSVPRPVEVFQRMVASVSILALLSSSLPAQTGQTTAATLPDSPQQSAAVKPHSQPEYAAPMQQYAQPYSMLGVWKPYLPHELPQPVLKNNSDRLHSLLKDGKLMLSLNQAVALALENNFDIAIARYNLDIANTDLLLANSGGTVRGVSTGLLEGTPGGSAASPSTAGSRGGGSGGTSVGAGGSGAGSGGLVISTQNTVGSPIDSRDPVLTGTVTWDRQLMPVPTPVIYGSIKPLSLDENTNQYNFTYTQGWSTGMQAQVSYEN